MSPQPALFTILAQVTTNLRSVNGYGAPMSGAAVPVYDGPELSLTDDSPNSYVCIGWISSDDSAGGLQTSPATFGARADRMEEGTFNATVVASSGDTDASVARSTAQTIITDLTAATYGLTSSTFVAYWCDISSLDLRQYQTGSGVTVEAAITFSYRVQVGA
jgi:hypothetical protein